MELELTTNDRIDEGGGFGGTGDLHLQKAERSGPLYFIWVHYGTLSRAKEVLEGKWVKRWWEQEELSLASAWEAAESGGSGEADK